MKIRCPDCKNVFEVLPIDYGNMAACPSCKKEYRIPGGKPKEPDLSNAQYVKPIYKNPITGETNPTGCTSCGQQPEARKENSRPQGPDYMI